MVHWRRTPNDARVIQDVDNWCLDPARDIMNMLKRCHSVDPAGSMQSRTLGVNSIKPVVEQLTSNKATKATKQVLEPFRDNLGQRRLPVISRKIRCCWSSKLRALHALPSSDVPGS